MDCRRVARAAFQILGMPLRSPAALTAGAAGAPSASEEVPAAPEKVPLRTELKCVTWNIAAINNNPFEYYATLEGEMGVEYERLMTAVQDFIDAPGEKDVVVGKVFTPAMFTKLRRAMSAQGWDGIDEVEDLWIEDFSQRKIIANFLSDASLGAKRFASMPDRFTNTINCANGAVVCRPTIINNYQGPLPNLASWFDQWFDFFFKADVTVKNKNGEAEVKKVCELLQPIKRAKYPAVTEEEEGISIPLQTLCQAIFDAIMVHIMNRVGSDEGVDWHRIKVALCDALVVNKQARVINILAEQPAYFDADIIFLQEVAGAFVSAFQQNAKLNERFLLLAPGNADHVRDQNSLVLLARDRIPPATEPGSCAEELALREVLGRDVPVADGDVCAFHMPLYLGGSGGGLKTLDVVLASFHGDTAGLASTPVVTALREVAAQRRVPIIFGLDANTHRLKDENGSSKHVGDFLNDLGEGQDVLKHCWGDSDCAEWNTTFNARTYLQPQLNKAVKYNDRHASKMTDCNPKDFILFSSSTFQLGTPASKDNTGNGMFVEGMDFPTLSFPSDHAIVSASIRMSQP
mmetsp:Transcript_8129/g.20335  ORF Transcript_8129/g.20335 Transcript_8129/m.20335 type:complete len:575 (-) Transcript_8129:121-1845(-)